MRTPRLSVIEPIRIVAVRRHGRTIRLSVLGGTAARHRIHFRFRTRAEAAGQVECVTRWMLDETCLAYVSGGRESALVATDALLARAVA